MRVVVMDRDMSAPLTVIDIPHSLMRQVADGMSYIQLPVPEHFITWVRKTDTLPHEISMLRIVRLKMEPIVTGDNSTPNGRRILYYNAIPDNEELALLLRATFLPGQLTELQRRESAAFLQGAFSGFGK